MHGVSQGTKKANNVRVMQSVTFSGLVSTVARTNLQVPNSFRRFLNPTASERDTRRFTHLHRLEMLRNTKQLDISKRRNERQKSRIAASRASFILNVTSLTLALESIIGQVKVPGRWGVVQMMNMIEVNIAGRRSGTDTRW
jgi:hypothetical protein